MKYRTRTYYTADQKALMWERWKEGATLHEIARLFDRAHTSVRGILAETGGIRPAERLRGEVALTCRVQEEQLQLHRDGRPPFLQLCPADPMPYRRAYICGIPILIDGYFVNRVVFGKCDSDDQRKQKSNG